MIQVSPETLKRLRARGPITLLPRIEKNPVVLEMMKRRLIQAGGPGSGRHPENKYVNNILNRHIGNVQTLPL